MDSELRSMVMAYRVTELQALLGFAGKNKTGRKNELQARALELVKAKSPPIVLKIRELYRSIQISNYSQPLNPNLGATASSLLGSGKASYGSGAYSTDTKFVQESTTNSFGRSVSFQRVIGGDGQLRTIPICPDIKMKELPFFDIMATLLRPTSLLNQGQSPKQETQHSFCLSPSQAGDITNSRDVIPNEATYPPTKILYSVQVQLRFCALDSTEEQDDLFPQGLIVKVNGRPVQLPTPIPSNRPGVEPKRPSKPLNITSNVRCCPLSTNTIHVSWLADQQRNYCMLVNIVKKLTAEQLFGRLKAKRIQPADFTRGRIKEITTAEEEDLCAPTSIRVSVACPLGKSRMAYPCRATTCKHLQCFDANLFLLMNERKPTFVCPVCNKHLKFGDLCIDGYFMDVIKNLSIDSGNEIELFADGSWLPAVKVKSETENIEPPPKRLKSEPKPVAVGANETIDLDDDIAILDDDDVKPTTTSSTSQSKAAPAAEPEIIDLIDSSDEEDDAEPARQSAPVSIPQPQEDDETETVQSVVSQQPQQQDDDDTEEEVGIRRPRRRKANVSYVEDSSSDSTSTNDGDVTTTPAATSRQPRSPACIELSDSGSPSPSPEPARRPFASVGSSSSSSTQASSTANNNRSGSGSSSTIYTSSGTAMGMAPTVATPTAVVAATGTTGSSNSNNSRSHPLHPYQYQQHQSPFYSSSSTYSISSSSSSPALSAGVHHHGGHHPGTVPTTSSAFFPSNISIPGYTAYDSSTASAIHRSTMSAASTIPSWEDDLNSFINPQTITYSGATLDSLAASASMFDDILNVATAAAVSGHHPFSTSSTSSSTTLFNPHSAGGAAGGGSRGGGGISGAGMSGYAGGWM